MHYRNFMSFVLGVSLLLSCGVMVMAQGTGDGTPTQRIDVMRSRLDTMRRSLNSAISSINAKDGADKKADVDDPRTRLRGLEQEASSVLSEVNNLSAKQQRSERIETSDLEKLETSITELNTRVQAALQATAGARGASNQVAAAEPQKKKKKGKFLGIFGGGGGDDKYAELTDTAAPGRDRQLFEVAAKEVRKGNYDTGRLLFNTIINTYPESPFLALSKLAIADSFYLEGTTSGLIQASAAYQDWLTFFPTDPLSDRVMLKMAEAEMRQMGLADRDVSRARKAEQRLKALLQQFPDTSLKDTVKTYLFQVQENLGMHNLKIARFYQSKFERGVGGLKGAQSRLREILEKYPNFTYKDETLFRLGWLYIQEEEPDEAAKYFQSIVRDFPNGDYVEKAKEELQKIGAPIPDPDPIKVKMLPPERPGMMRSLLTEITGSANISVEKDGVLISKDGKEGSDLIDQAIANGGTLPATTPTAPQQQRRAPARQFPQGTTGTPEKPSTEKPSTTPEASTPPPPAQPTQTNNGAKP